MAMLVYYVFGGDLSAKLWAIQWGKAEKNHQMLALFASHWRCGKSTTCHGIFKGNPMGFPLLRNADLMSKACPKPKDSCTKNLLNPSCLCISKWQWVKTLYPCSSHQNSWDLWMFIPLKMVLIGIDS